MNEIARKVIEAGIRAPSGDNCQPWRFEVGGNEIEVFSIPERDTSLYSWGGRASFVAHGALLENMAIAASALGYEDDIKLFSEGSGDDLVATVSLNKAAPRGKSSGRSSRFLFEENIFQNSSENLCCNPLFI